MTDCLFCKFVDRDIKADVVFEDEEVLAFRDINPQAPTHVLVIPKRHIATLNDLDHDDHGLTGKLVATAARIAADEGLSEYGYRVVMNCNTAAGQTVFHIHLHLLGGRQMTWPPG